MPLKRSPPNKANTNSPITSAIKTLTVPLHTLDRSQSDSKLDEYNTENTSGYNITQRCKRRRDDDFAINFDNFKEEMRTMFQSLMSSQQKELDIIKSNLNDIQQSNYNIDSSIALLSTQNDEFKKKIDQLQLQAKRDSDHICLLEEKIEDLQRESRKSCIEIKNAPKKNNENKDDLINMVCKLSENISCKVEKSDIKDIYRVRGKGTANKITPIIVELSSTIQKAEVIKMCKSYNIKNNKSKLQAKHLGLTIKADDPIYISEQLTAKASRLYFLARDLTKTKQYKFCWTSFGRVYVRLNETSPIIQIKNETQVHHLQQGQQDAK